MRKLVVPAVLALAAGTVAVYVIAGRNGLPLVGTRTLGDVPSMSAAEAASHRAERYAAIASIEGLLALPNRFARMEALYALAGRSDSAAVQNLIFQGAGIADASDRKDVLLVLFARLTELDALSALALSRTPDFASDPAFEREVWGRWGALDLDAALRHAARLDGAERHRAAQALFAAYDHWGSEETSLIAKRLAVHPDSRTRSAHVDDLAYTDPAAAIDYVHAIDSPLHRRQAAAHLGRLLGRNGLDSIDRWSAQFRVPALRRAFEDAAARAAAEVDPYGTLESLLAGGGAPEGRSRLASAFSTVAAEDMDQALAWLERLDDPRQQQYVGKAIAGQLAHSDPLRALAWARDNDRSAERSLYTAVLAAVSEVDPQLAIADAKRLEHRWRRVVALGTVARNLSEHDPARAAALLSDLEDPDARTFMMQHITTNWMQSDPDAALGWIMSSEVRDRNDLMSTAARVVSRADVDAALRLLPRLDKDVAPVWRQQIATSLASQRSLPQAQSFIAKFEGTPEYPRLIAGVVQGLASTDGEAAVEMLDRVPESPDRGMLYQMVFMQYARQSPRGAAEAAVSLTNENQRAGALRQVLRQWTESDPTTAEQWVDNRTHGPERYSAIAGISSRWSELTPSRTRMLKSIEDPMQRRNAISNVIYRIAREDRDRAEQALRRFDFPKAEKQQVLRNLQNVPDRSTSLFIRGY